MQLIPFPTHCPPTPRTCNHKQFMPQPSSSSSSSSTTNAVPPPPPDLRTVLSGKTARFKQTYTNFWAIPGAKADVEAYRADREHVYKVLINGDSEFMYKDGKLNTPFTNLTPKTALHVFAESADSMLLGNVESYHTGLYPGKEGAAGCSFVHLLAIPKTRIYNAVSITPDEIRIVDDMAQLFERWWEQSGGVKAYSAREAQLAQSQFENLTTTTTTTKASLTLTQEQLSTHTRAMQTAAATLQVSDFVYVFHADPTPSVPHLHLHIIAAPAAVRVHSTAAHDAKAVLWSEIRPALMQLAKTHAGLVANAKVGEEEYAIAVAEKAPLAGVSMVQVKEPPFLRNPVVVVVPESDAAAVNINPAST